MKRGAQSLQDEDGLVAALGRARQVAAVGQGQGSGEVELDESEELGQGADSRRSAQQAPAQSPAPAERPPLVWSGTAYFEGRTGTSGFSIWPRRPISRCHWSGFSSAVNWASGPPSIGW